MKRDLDFSAEDTGHACAVVAPELDLLPKPVAVLTGPPPQDVRAQLMTLRDQYVELSSRGRYVDAAGREWRQLPSTWRMVLLMVGGVGQDVENLSDLAQRDWNEMPGPEQDTVRGVVRGAKRYLGRLTALAARV